MTAALDAVTRKKDRPEPTAEQQLAEELVARARAQGVLLTGRDGLLKQLAKAVLETALNAHHQDHPRPGRRAAGRRIGLRRVNWT